MTVDILRAETNALAVLDNTNEALARLGQWVEAARNAHQLVAPLVDTAFVPDAYKPRVDPRATPEQRKAAYEMAVANATAAVLQGLSLGLDPLVALQQIYIVHGRPGMYAKLMVALVQSRGHEVWVEDLTDTRAVVCGRRKGTDYTERVTVTMDQARKAGWTRNDNYSKTPQDMLWSRAAGRVCDRIASDVLKGIASVEEIQDSIQVDATAGDGTRTVTPRKRTPAPEQTAIPATPEPEPPLDDEPASATEPEPEQQAPTPKGRTRKAQPATPPEPDLEPELDPPSGGEAPITKPQLTKLHILMQDTGFTDRDEGLAYLAAKADRQIASSKELTKREAISIIDALESLNDGPPADAEAEPTLDDGGTIYNQHEPTRRAR